MSTNTVIPSYIHVTYYSIFHLSWVTLEFLTGLMSWFWLQKFTKSRWVYQRKEVSITLWLWRVKEANSYGIPIGRLLITEEKWVCLSEIRKKIAIKSIEMCFCFRFYVLETPTSKLMGMILFWWSKQPRGVSYK